MKKLIGNIGRRVWRAGVRGAAVAAVVNLALFLIGRAAGASFVVGSGADQASVSASHVVLSSVFAMVLATGVAALAASRHAGLRIVQVGAVVVALLSLAGPLQLGDGPGTTALLAAMHLVVAATFVLATRGAVPSPGSRAGEQRTVTAAILGTDQDGPKSRPRAS